MASSEVCSLTSKLEEQLTCSICSEQLKNAKALPCLHSFCHDCLVEIIQNKKIACPECRKSLEIENPPDISFLPSNFIVNNILTTIAGGTEHGEASAEPGCSNCENDMAAEYKCSECCMHLCHLCSESHIYSEETRSHTIIPVDEGDTNKNIPNLSDSTVCAKHNEKLGGFCSVCQISICQACHQAHSSRSLDAICGKEKSEICTLLEKVKNERTRLSENFSAIKESEENLLAKKETVIPEIVNFFDELVRSITKQKEELVEQAMTLFHGRQKEFLGPTENLELALTKCDNVIRSAEEKLDTGSDVEVLDQKARVEECFEFLSKTTSIAVDKKQPTIKFVAQYSTKEIEEIFLKRCFVLGDVASPAVCTASFKYPENGAILVGKPCAITVVCRDNSNQEMDSGGQLITPIFTGLKVNDVSVVDNNNGCYDALFTAKEIGVMNFQALINSYPAKRCYLTAKVTWNMRENIGNGILSDGGLTLTGDRAFGNWCYRVGGYCFTTGVYTWKVLIKFTGDHTAFAFKREIEVGVIDGDADLSHDAIKNHHTRKWVGKCRAEVVAMMKLDMGHRVLTVQFSGGTDTGDRSVAPAQYRFDVKADRVCPYFGLKGKHSTLTISSCN